MGMERIVEFPSSPPSWEALRDLLSTRGFPLQIRMIDGQLAFPDEAPPENWTELRLGTPQGMVTMRRTGNRLSFITWGNADPTLLRAWNALAWASASIGNGTIQLDGTGVDSGTFATRVELPDSLKP